MWSPIPFSITAEDVRIVEQAILPSQGHVLLCIGSAGDTPLGLLANDVERVDVIDASFPQLCLAILKATAAKEFELPEYRTLLGVVPDGESALSLYDRVHPHLPARVAAFWRRYRGLIRKGLLWQGGLVRQISLTRAVLVALVGTQWLERLSRCETPVQASALFDEMLSSRRGRLCAGMTVNPIARVLYFPRKAFRHLPPGHSPERFLIDKGREMLCRRPLADNPYLYPFVFGRYASPNCVPAYLSEDCYDVIRTRVDRLRFIHAHLHQYLRSSQPRSYHGLALSNVVDWMSQPELEELLVHLARAGVAGGRAILFSRSAGIDIPASLSAVLELDVAEGNRLLAEDRTGYYNSVDVLRVIG